MIVASPANDETYAVHEWVRSDHRTSKLRPNHHPEFQLSRWCSGVPCHEGIKRRVKEDAVLCGRSILTRLSKNGVGQHNGLVILPTIWGAITNLQKKRR